MTTQTRPKLHQYKVYGMAAVVVTATSPEAAKRIAATSYGLDVRGAPEEISDARPFFTVNARLYGEESA